LKFTVPKQWNNY